MRIYVQTPEKSDMPDYLMYIAGILAGDYEELEEQEDGFEWAIDNQPSQPNPWTDIVTQQHNANIMRSRGARGIL